MIDAGTGKVAETIDLDADPEAAVSDGEGTACINLADKQVIVVVDPKALVVRKTYPIVQQQQKQPYGRRHPGFRFRMEIYLTASVPKDSNVGFMQATAFQ